MVKRQAAEKNIFSAAEQGREILDKAIAGDKSKLDEVFGGTCERIGRLRTSYDSCSELGLEKDQRWRHLIERIETVEAILKDLGSFKPWKPGAVIAPETLKYKGIRRRVSPGREVRFRPELIGGACEFSVEGVMPQGLTLDPATGEIVGKVTASSSTPLKIEVIAKNESGEVRTQFEFAVVEPPPRGLTYPYFEDGTLLVVGAPVVLQPELDAGYGRRFKVTPELPEGLELEEHSGIIRGAPAAPSQPKAYTVTASNPGGEATVTLTFGATVPPPEDLSYPELPEELPQGRSVHFEPELQEGIPTAFTVTPALPAGLTLDRATGVIRGAPTAPADLQEYIIVASNDGGKTSVGVSFSVRSTAPTSLAYEGAQGSYTNVTMVSLTPKVVGGTPDTFTVEPALPEGLVLSGTSGEITGIPSLCEKRTWTITAGNSSGSCSTELSFAVTRAPPTKLTYPEVVEVYAAGRAVELNPSMDGEVDEFSVTPALPSGLSLDPKSGVISGTPPGGTPEASYVVTASNEVGQTSVSLKFAVKVMPPESIKYDFADDNYAVGETVNLVPMVVGGATQFSVEPALPSGLTLDPATGVLSGAATVVAKRQTYVVTVSNEGGHTSVELEFQVNENPPGSIGYPLLSDTLVIGDEVEVDPDVDSGDFAFKVTPNLPAGLAFDEKTGRISGAPTEEQAETKYTVVVSNSAGKVSTEFSLVVEKPAAEAVINAAFAQQIEEITDIGELLEKAPQKDLSFGDWMIWMVHRAWLNDETLTDLNFNHCRMPLPHEEWRVAPKLVKALETNTNLVNLSLAQSNLQKPQGHELAEALKKNCSLVQLNIESNRLDSACMQAIAQGIQQNPSTTLEVLRVSHQLGMGKYYGRPVEQAFGEMMQVNTSITKLGLVVDDRHWMNSINGYLTRNGDMARRRRKRAKSTNFEEALPTEDHTLSRLHLEVPPAAKLSEVISNEAAHTGVFIEYLAQNKMVPQPSQLQSYAKSAGTPLKYTELKPTIEQCRMALLKAAHGTDVSVVDNFNATIEGSFRGVKVNGSNWTVEVLRDQKRCMCQAAKEPAIAISSKWAAWLRGEAESTETKEEENDADEQ
eukprot:TRINITY_DN63808_c0_g1_i1.p1 TRINITY_DN63808_c0_g1~~TRINITY_DN63808_c0_g1_i1.p1  ORF type:complete len:1148 (-),score=258.39 TRINITY_DN63808_c0_g1_i1:85-3348(-)